MAVQPNIQRVANGPQHSGSGTDEAKAKVYAAALRTFLAPWRQDRAAVAIKIKQEDGTSRRSASGARDGIPCVPHLVSALAGGVQHAKTILREFSTVCAEQLRDRHRNDKNEESDSTSAAMQCPQQHRADLEAGVWCLVVPHSAS